MSIEQTPPPPHKLNEQPASSPSGEQPVMKDTARPFSPLWNHRLRQPGREGRTVTAQRVAQSRRRTGRR